jgi:anti-anti-sigma factor
VKPLVVLIPKIMPSKRNINGVNPKERHNVVRELERAIGQASRPRVVLDCSELEEMRLPEVRMLMACLEWVMKRNGDVRLASVSPKSREILSNSGIEGLFRIYDSRESAIRSFESHPNFEIIGEGPYSDLRGFGQIEEGNAPSFFQLTAVRKHGEIDENRNEETNLPE